MYLFSDAYFLDNTMSGHCIGNTFEDCDACPYDHIASVAELLRRFHAVAHAVLRNLFTSDYEVIPKPLPQVVNDCPPVW